MPITLAPIGRPNVYVQTNALIEAPVVAAAGFDKTGPGALRFTASNSGMAGTIRVYEGLLQAGNNGSSGHLGNSTIELSGSAGFTVRRNGGSLALNNTLTGNTTGTVAFQTNGSFVATINKANTYAAATTISPTTSGVSGTVQLGINNGLPTSTVLTITNSGSSVQTFGLNGFSQTLGGLATSAGGSATNSKVTLGNGTLTVNDASARTFAGEISGAGNLVKQGAGAWTLSAANTYTGTTSVAGGTLVCTTPNALGAGPLAIASGGAKVQLNFSGTRTVASLSVVGGGLAGNGTYGSSTSPARFKNNDYFSGNGTLTVGPGGAGPTNTAPTASGQSPSTNEDIPLSLTLAGNDVDNHPLAYIIVTPPTRGTLSGSGPGRTYTPSANLSGADSFTYKVSDGELESAVATVSITVNALNDPPVANGQSLSTTEETAKAITLTGSDVENQALNFSIVTQPTKGTLSGTGAARIYTPSLNQTGADSFTFTASDGGAASTPATVAITISPVNDLPTASAQTVQTYLNLATPITLGGNDVDGDVLSYTVVTHPANGTLSGTAPNLTYTPPAGFLGTTSFTFKVNDASGDSLPATVTVVVNPTPALQQFIYSNLSSNTAPGTLWSAGTSWSAVPVSATNTALVLGNGTLLAASASVHSSQDSLVPFQLNQLQMSYAGPASGTAPSVTINTNAITFVNNASVAPTIALNATGGSTNKPQLVFAGGVTFGNHTTISGTSDLLISGGINNSGDAVVTKTGANTLRIQSSNENYTGNFTVSGGLLQIGNNGGSGDIGSGTITLSGGGAFTVRRSGGELAFNNTIVGSGNVNFQAKDGFVAILYKANTYAGNTTIAPTGAGVSGALQLGIANGLPPSTILTISHSGSSVQTFDLDGFNQTLAGLATATGGTAVTAKVTLGTATLTIADASARTFAGEISGPGNLVKQGAGTWTLSGINTYTGSTSVAGGTLVCTLPGSLGGGPLNIAAGGAKLNLAVAGTRQIASLSFNGGAPQANGSYGSSASPARFKNDTYFSGVGTVTVGPLNSAPVADAQSTTTDEDTVLALTLSGSDVDNHPLTYTVLTQPTKGTLSGTAPALTYTPAANESGADSFTFIVNDGEVDSAPATVSLTVLPVNDAPVAFAQSTGTAEDTAVPVTLSGSDTEAQALTYVIVTPPTKGTLSGTAPALTYTPSANANGADSFTFKVNDGAPNFADSAPATVSLTIAPVNDAPVAAAQSLTTAEDTALSVTLSGSDAENQALTYILVTPPTKGTLSGTAPALTYTPAANENGADSFTFKVSDGTADSAVATVALTVTAVNDAPAAAAQGLSTAEDTAVSVTLSGSDTEGQALTYVIVTPPTNGTLSGTAPALTYTPSANANGADSFTFKVNDGTADSAPATVSLTVAPVNDAPVAAAQSRSTPEDTALSVTLSGSDIEDQALSYTIVTPPTKGTLSGTAPALTYTPSANTSGADSFTFKVNDGTADSAVATVSLTVSAVNDAPVAAAQGLSTAEDTAVALTLAGNDVENEALTYTIVTPPTKGTLSGTAPALTYTPAANENGADSFAFKVNDGTADSALATVSLTVIPVNDLPSATAQAVETIFGVAVPITLAGTDVETTSLTYTVVTTPTHGTLTGTAPALLYTPNSGYQGPDGFTFKINDGTADSAAATVAITVQPSAAPTAFLFNSTTSNTSPGTTWSAGTYWTAIPVGAPTTTLTFGNGATLTAGQTVFTSNDLGNFTLNRLNMNYAGPASGTFPSLTLSTGPLTFASNGALAPVIELGATGGATNKPYLIFAGAVTFASPTTISGASDALFTGTLANAGAASVTKTGAGTLRVESNNVAYTGDFSVSAGVLQIGNNSAGGDLGTGTITLGGSGSLTVRKSAALALNNRIVGTTTGGVSFQLRSGATVSLLKANTYSANTTISPTTSGVTGTVQLGIADGLPASTVLTITNSGTSLQTFSLNGFDQTLGGLATGTGGNSTNSIVTNSGAPASLTIAGSATTSYAGTLSGAVDLIKSGAGSQSFTGSLTYTGDTTVAGGTLTLHSANPNNQSSFVSLEATGATLNLNFNGTDTVEMLFIGGFQQPAGVYKAIGNPLGGTAIPQLTGSGTLTVTSSALP